LNVKRTRILAGRSYSRPAIDFVSNAKKSQLAAKDKNALIVAYCGNPVASLSPRVPTPPKNSATKYPTLTAGISGWKDARRKLRKANERSAEFRFGSSAVLLNINFNPSVVPARRQRRNFL